MEEKRDRPVEVENGAEVNGLELIADARIRQMEAMAGHWLEEENRTRGELALVAACYVLPEQMRAVTGQVIGGRVAGQVSLDLVRTLWPTVQSDRLPNRFSPSPDDRISELATAGAFIVAEIDRILRAKRAAARGELSPPARAWGER